MEDNIIYIVIGAVIVGIAAWQILAHRKQQDDFWKDEDDD